MNLYKVNINKQNKKFYVLANDSAQAYRKVREKLDKWNWYFKSQRELHSVELLAEDYQYTDAEGILFK
jgi:hypothetical protein